MQLFFNPLDLLSRRGTLLRIQLLCRPAGEPSMGAVHDRAHHLQIADQFGGRPGREFLLPLRFEKQRRIFQNALADGRRSPAPGGVQLARLACGAVMLHENGRHALAVFQALTGHRHQKLHRYLRCNLAFANLPLDRFRQQLHQRQAP